MFRDPADGPRSQLARYAFGWSDEKPDAIFWLIIGCMFAYVVYRFATM
jgi:hypothetical protein